MTSEVLHEQAATTIPVGSVVFRTDLYPRIDHDQAKAQEYAENIEKLPPILVNQRYELIDGRHRLIAHQLQNREEISVVIEETRSDDHLLERAIETNATHGLQMSAADKRQMAIRFYASGERGAGRKEQLARLLSVSVKSVNNWVSDLDQAAREERKKIIADMHAKCYTEIEISEAVALTRQQVNNEVQQILESFPKIAKVQFSEDDWTPPLYNVWTFAKKTNQVSHFGNTEQRITENLLYLYTQPNDIVVDPFGGGGSTLDVCKKRGRRCWISDRAPKAGMESKLRTMDITKELPPLNKRWSDVALVYLDPPYWAQARGQYSDDADDLGNYENADDFHDAMADVVRRFAEKMRNGSRIAMIIQPTQWNSPGRQFTDHVFEIVKRTHSANLSVINRVSCPYSSEQYNAQMVEWAKQNRALLVLTRELIVWSVNK